MVHSARTLLFVVLLGAPAAAEESKPRSKSAFLFEREPEAVKVLIDPKEVIEGTRKPEPKDAIPAIWEPKHVTAAQARWLRDEDRVLGVLMKGEARAYPLRFIVRHEMVNDVLGGVPIAPNY